MREIEEWRDITNYEGVYQVSSLGKIRRWRKKSKRYDELKLCLDKTKGYYFVNLSLNSIVKKFWIHSLVAQIFLKHVPCRMEIVIDHDDNDKLNNNKNNLKLISNRENISKDRSTTTNITGVFCKKLKDGNFTYCTKITINGMIIRFKNTRNIEIAEEYYKLALFYINEFKDIKQFKKLIYDKTKVVVVQ